MNDGWAFGFWSSVSFSGQYAWVLELDRYLLSIPPGAHCFVFCTCMALGDQSAFSFALILYGIAMLHSLLFLCPASLWLNMLTLLCHLF